MTKLLAAVDNSTAALPVVGTACAVAELFGAKVEVLHVGEGGDAGARSGDDIARAAADAALVPYWRADGEPAERLLAAAADPDVFAIAVAARSLDRADAPADAPSSAPRGVWAVGGTTRALITGLMKPVVVVPPESDAPARIDRIVLPLDESRTTTDALTSTARALAASDAELVVLHVCAPDAAPRFSEQPQHETQSWSREFLSRYWPAPARRARLELRMGEPADAVLDTMTRLAADLVVVAWGRSLDAGRAEIVRRVLGHEHVPVLLLAVAI